MRNELKVWRGKKEAKKQKGWMSILHVEMVEIKREKLNSLLDWEKRKSLVVCFCRRKNSLSCTYIHTNTNDYVAELMVSRKWEQYTNIWSMSARKTTGMLEKNFFQLQNILQVVAYIFINIYVTDHTLNQIKMNSHCRVEFIILDKG